MPHIDPLTIQQAPEDAAPVLRAIEDKFGKSLNIFSTLAHVPDALKGVTQIDSGIKEHLPGKYRELAYFKASDLNDCSYCSHYHRAAAKEAGISEEKLAAIGDFESSDLFDQQERAVLSYADQLTRTADVDASVVRRLKEFLSDQELVALAVTVALANFTNRFNHGLDIQLP